MVTGNTIASSLVLEFPAITNFLTPGTMLETKVNKSFNEG